MRKFLGHPSAIIARFMEYSKPFYIEIPDESVQSFDIIMKRATSSTPSSTFVYSTDGGMTYPHEITSTTGSTRTVINPADLKDRRIFMKAKDVNESFATSGANYTYMLFLKHGRNEDLDSPVNLGGNIESLRFNRFESYINDPQPLPDFCYCRMFFSNSKKSPISDASRLALPDSAMSQYCFNSMFMGCANMNSAPKLNSVSLAEGCYSNMFYGCSSLGKAPDLLAKTLARLCYQSMFRDCSGLSYLKVGFDAWEPGTATQSWLTNAGSNVEYKLFDCSEELENATTTRSGDRVPADWSFPERT